MNTNTDNPGGEPARVGGVAESEPAANAASAKVEEPYQAGQTPQQGGANTTYISPELRPTGDGSATPNGGEPTRQWNVPPASTPPPAYTPQQPYVAPEQGRRRYGTPILGPVLLIAAGVVFLLNTLNFVPWSIWGQLWKLWPLILVAIGLDLLFGRRNPLVSLVIVLVVLAAGIGLVYAYGGLNPPGPLAQTTLDVPLNSAKTADVRIEMGVGELRVDGDLRDPAKLAAGRLDYFGNYQKPDQTTSTSGNTANLTLDQRADNMNFDPFNWFGNEDRSLDGSLDWEIHLNPAIPTSLDVQTGAGNGTLDLGQMKVTNLVVQRGVGNVEITLPSSGSTDARIQGGVGNANITVPKDVAARIKVNKGIGNANVSGFKSVGNDTYESEGYSSSAANRVELTVESGVGNVNIRSR